MSDGTFALTFFAYEEARGSGGRVINAVTKNRGVAQGYTHQ
jgi:hypothetical protein